MSDQNKAVAVKFGENGRFYDYLSGGFNLAIGDRVMVPMRGGEISVEVVEIKDHSEVAKVAVARRDVRTEEQRASKHPNGAHRYGPDGTEFDEEGNTINAGEPA
ncbi:hypothetical protein EN781_00350 [Mesorhizobium sp. M4A.F.Ca.ET.090.04.2.1]|uniref:hypothetical protein n=1 Tax=Mesorhizobium sp. M4A.F.Ca.ET.090.04.2.1 TaxID=2496663 RepID=UPI000FCB28FB|nr:hypothetical protein [Mesorhizobium sp. M4A.F.Ca.ET.090.04.2.1]RVC47621.1 hypothetical protein EN781_00350 [Mesorhizobium sp. M4A.F.Ca.ET.090.04.2.1]